jgi:ureidoglycolate dehydrogenase (NAD+)
MEHDADRPVVVEHTALVGLVVAVLERVGVPEPHGQRIAGVLVDRELCGYDDHGLPALPAFMSVYRAGGFNPTPEVRVLQDGPSVTLLDGDRGPGVLVATLAMERCIAKARTQGFACAGVRNSGHFLAAGSYAVMAADAGMIGFAASNTDARMAPTGGLTPVFGTNPFAYALPAGRHVPVVFDMATSAVSHSKMGAAARAGREVPAGLIEDAEGRPTTTPRALAGEWLMVPLGGAKGYGLALVVDALCGVLTGGAFGRDAGFKDGKAGHFFWALDVSHFMPREEFLARMDAQIDQIKASKRRPGVAEIRVPGERGQRRKRELLARGQIPLSAKTWRTLEQCAAGIGVQLPAVQTGQA